MLLSMFFINNDGALLGECGNLKKDKNRLCIELENIQYWNEMKNILIIVKMRKNLLSRKL